MRICVSAVADSLNAQVDPRFGRCQYFVIVDSETMRFEAIPNTATGAMSGAGIQAAQMVASMDVKVLITGNVGPNAFQTLSAAGIKIVTSTFGTVKEVVERYKRGELREKTSAPIVHGHLGMGRRRGGRGRGGRWRQR